MKVIVSNYQSMLWLLFVSFTGTACHPHVDAPKNTNPKIADEKITAANYLGGQAFCESYKAANPALKWKGTGAEFSRRVEVPIDYDSKNSGTRSIYTWTPKPFDPRKQTFIFVQGGPGGNSHSEDDITNNAFNEIYFDQRGIGCSAPQTYDEYMTATDYSSLNTIRDMDVIRQAYGIKKWSVYGASYGTVPATMYGSRFADHVTAVVLDGTVMFWDNSESEFNVTKLNYALDMLSEGQRRGFNEYMHCCPV